MDSNILRINPLSKFFPNLKSPRNVWIQFFGKNAPPKQNDFRLLYPSGFTFTVASHMYFMDLEKRCQIWEHKTVHHHQKRLEWGYSDILLQYVSENWMKLLLRTDLFGNFMCVGASRYDNERTFFAESTQNSLNHWLFAGFCSTVHILSRYHRTLLHYEKLGQCTNDAFTS